MKAMVEEGVEGDAYVGTSAASDVSHSPHPERIPMFTDAQRFQFLTTFACPTRQGNGTAAWSLDIPPSLLPRAPSFREAIDQVLTTMHLGLRQVLLHEGAPDIAEDLRQLELFSPSPAQEDPCP
jgi:hypothetical protein